MIKRIQTTKKKLQIDSLSLKELKELVKQIAVKLGEDSDACAEECQNRIKEGKTKTNIVSQNIQNMRNGEQTRKQEEKEDKEISAKRREEEKQQLEEKKKRDEAAKEGKVICGSLDR